MKEFLLRKMSQQSRGAILDEIGYEFKALAAAVIRIRDFVMIVLGAEVGEAPDFVFLRRGLG